MWMQWTTVKEIDEIAYGLKEINGMVYSLK